MNERIKRLAVQAKLRAPIMLQHWGKIDALTDSEQEELQNIEKFAELIVRECISKCESIADMATITNRGEMARKTKATADCCATMIKQHFGVEE